MGGLRALFKRTTKIKSLLASGATRSQVIEELDVRDAYRLWAPTYGIETATSALDEELAREMLAGLPHKRLLDAGCGIGRRTQSIPEAIGIDLSPDMVGESSANNLIVGDIREMPFESDRFDMVWCRLVLGHLPDPARAYQELCRVCMPGGYVFITDFHPDAAAAGHSRTLTDNMGTVYKIEHYVHSNHTQLAADVGMALISNRYGAVGPSVYEFYRRGIGLKAYKKDLGLKLVDAFLFKKPDVMLSERFV
jgi:SAM-dependent methyltransferase